MDANTYRRSAAAALAWRLGLETPKARMGTARRIIKARETVDETARRVWAECEAMYVRHCKMCEGMLEPNEEEFCCTHCEAEFRGII